VQVPILKQGAYLIATVQSALTDEDLKQLRDALVGQVSKVRARGVIVDVTALDVMDSFAVRTLRDIAHMARLRGAETVIVGIQPDVAFAMVQLGLTLKGVATVLDLEPELRLTLAAGASFALDESQAPVLIAQSATSYTFRYWTIGEFDSDALAGAFSIAFASPKSSTFTLPWGVILTLAGFRSR